MHSLSFGELLLIFGIIVVLFGGSRLSGIGKSLGEGISNFKKGLNGSNSDESINKQQSSQQASVPQPATVYIQNQQIPFQQAQKQQNTVDIDSKES